MNKATLDSTSHNKVVPDSVFCNCKTRENYNFLKKDNDYVFFNRTGLERIGVVESEIGLLLGWSASSGCGTPLQKTRKNVGQRGLCLWPLRCLSQFLAERRNRLLRGLMFLRTFHRWGGLVFIVYVFPNLMVIRILSHWMGYFLFLLISDLIRDTEGAFY